MIVFGQSGCIRLKCFYPWKVVVNRQRDCIGAKLVIFLKSSCIRKKVAGVNGLYSGRVVLFGQKWLNLGKVVIFGRKRLYSGKVVVLGQKWLY